MVKNAQNQKQLRSRNQSAAAGRSLASPNNLPMSRQAFNYPQAPPSVNKINYRKLKENILSQKPSPPNMSRVSSPKSNEDLTENNYMNIKLGTNIKSV